MPLFGAQQVSPVEASTSCSTASTVEAIGVGGRMNGGRIGGIGQQQRPRRIGPSNGRGGGRSTNWKAKCAMRGGDIPPFGILNIWSIFI